MDGHLEVWTDSGRSLLPLSSTRCTVGSSPETTRRSTIVRCRQYALIECLAGTWFIEDLGSRNGTFVGGSRIARRRSFRPGEEFRLGRARVALRGVVAGGRPRTETIDERRWSLDASGRWAASRLRWRICVSRRPRRGDRTWSRAGSLVTPSGTDSCSRRAAEHFDWRQAHHRLTQVSAWPRARRPRPAPATNVATIVARRSHTPGT